MNARFDIICDKEPIVLSLKRPQYRDSDVVLLTGDVWHFNEDESSSFSVRPATLKEYTGEYETRAHRAALNGDHELKRV